MNHKFYLILSPLILLFFACESSNEKKQNRQIEITEVEQKEPTKISSTSSPNISKSIPSQKTVPKISPKKPIVKQSTPNKISPKEITPESYHYTFKDLNNQINNLDIKNDFYTFRNIKQPIVIINIMATWCPPCRGQIPHLSKLQQKFKEHLFIMAALVHDDITQKGLEKFIIAQKIRFYLSISQDENLNFIEMLMPRLKLSKDFPMPLTIVFVQGTYFTHYEGMIPEEMIESDINLLLEKIKK